MHGADPVEWKLWNRDVLKLAQQQNKPILISSGYYACHWCHVMQQENYKNQQTAHYLNQHFISVKIDRELDSELDASLIDFARKATGQAGWPQHVLLTPEGYPFAAFIYLPNNEFNLFLQRTAQLWQQQPTQISKLAKQASSQHSETQQDYTPLSKLAYNQFSEGLFNSVGQQKDDLSGGLKATSKFPKAPIINALLHVEVLPEDIEEWLIISLEQMQSEHLIDHIHGGFYRYTIDPEWQIPHFEKMTYTSAQLAQSYLLAGKRWQREDFLTTAQQTLQYLRTHLYSQEIGLYQSSQSAIDNNDIEGGDYIWSQQALKNTLTVEEYQLIIEEWGLEQTPPYEIGWHPRPIDHTLWPSIKKKLQTSVETIPKDYKMILSWNGLILSSLSYAANILQDAQYKEQATALAEKLSHLILQASPPRALSRNGDNMGLANLEDYAYIKRGLEDFQNLTGNQKYHKTLEQLNASIIDIFYQDEGGWQYSAVPALPSYQTNRIIEDSPTPSPSALVSCLKPESVYKNQGQLRINAIAYPSYLNALNCIEDTNPVK